MGETRPEYLCILLGVEILVLVGALIHFYTFCAVSAGSSKSTLFRLDSICVDSLLNAFFQIVKRDKIVQLVLSGITAIHVLVNRVSLQNVFFQSIKL